jgi:hypothetical protein
VNTAADDAFTPVKKFSGHAGQAYTSYDSHTGLTSIFLDVNGDSSADMVVQLAGRVYLIATDFIV